MGELSAVPGNPRIVQAHQDLSQLYDDEWFSDDESPSTDDEDDVCTVKYTLHEQEKCHMGAEFE